MIANVRHWLSRLQPLSAPDAELVRRFAGDRDEAAFAALVDRHGPMVLGAARRVVGDEHTAEDVFQATFVMLARRAGHFRHPAALPAWLHRTACNLARTALRARKRRHRAEAGAVAGPAGSPLDDLSSRELLAILDEELRRLPEAFRLPLILCCLEGRSQDETAALLGWTPGSVKGRLERGRHRLKDRLGRRGLTFAVVAGVPLLVGPPSLAGALREAALRAALGAGPLPPAVAALADGALRSPFVARWGTLLVVAALGLVGGGAGLALLTGSKGTEEPATPPATAEEKPATPQADALGEPLPEGAVARLGSSRLRVGNSAFALAPDGRAIITVSPQGVVRNFDAQTGRLLERRQITDRHDADPTGQAQAQLSADGKTAVIEDGRVTVWDVPSGKMIFRPQPDKGRRVGRPALSPDGKQLALVEWSDGRDTQALRVYDLKTGRGKDVGSVEFNVYDVRFSADGTRVVLSQISSRPGVREDTFACFDVAAGKQLWKLPRKGGEFALSPDGKTVVSAVYDGDPGFQIIETDPDSGKPAERFQPCPLAHPNDRLVFAPDNRTVVINNSNGVVTWDLRTGDAVTRLKPPPTRGRGWGPELGAISPDGRTVLTNLGHLQRWDLTTGKALFEAPPDDGLGGPIEHLGFTPDGKEVVASSWGINSGRWDVATGKQLNYTYTGERPGRQLVTTPGGLRALRCDSYKSPYEVTVYDPVAGKPLHTVRWAAPEEVGINGLRSYALTADGKTLLVAHGDEPGGTKKSYVTACDVASERRLARFDVAGTLYFPSSPFSPCGRWVVLAGKVYHVATGTALFAPGGEPGEVLIAGDRRNPSPVWFSPDGRLLAGRLSRKVGDQAAADTLAVWELASGTVLARFPKVGHVAQVAFAPDGRTVALLDGWGVHVHDLLTGKRLAAYPAADVLCNVTDRGCGTQTLAFAPDGRTLATGHLDGTVLLWKVPPAADDGAKEIAESDREGLWADLGSEAPAKARAAVERLARRPAAAVALLTGRFRPTPTPADPALAALVKDLDSEAFATREEATRKLRDYGAKAEPALRRELAATISPEVKRRIEEILAAIAPPLLRLPLAGDTLRGVRAIEVLERAGTPEARQLLQGWAEQTKDMHLAAEARATLGRAGAARPAGEAPRK
jgi:RNA polymerase sigma factor (sigma-70 family)